jgi:hypothetical protein
VQEFQHCAVAARFGNGWFESLGIVMSLADNAQGAQMAKAYYSTVFSQSADDIWTVIRDFNNYAVWVDGAGESQ